MSEFAEEISGQIAAVINRLGDGKYTHSSIYPLPPDAAYDEVVYPEEWIQTTGTAPSHLTVEIRRLDPDEMYRVYTVGHCQAAEQSEEAASISNGENAYQVRPAEVLTAVEAIGLFEHYYDHHSIPSGWHLREQAEFTTPVEAIAVKPAAGIANTPASSKAVAKSRVAAKQDTAAPQKTQRRQNSAGN